MPSDSGIYRSTGELREFVGEVMGLNGPYGKGEKGLKGWLRTPPHGLVRIGLGRGRAAYPGRPLSLSTRAQQGPLTPGGFR